MVGSRNSAAATVYDKFREGLGIVTSPHVLFICTGNYYRSRFAEAVFNHHARRQGIPWRAFSRGLSLFLPQGTLSPHVIVGLARRGIALTNTTMDPTPLTEANLRRAAIRIALFEPEHRPMVARLFPEWEAKTTYWRIPDLGEVTPDEGLAMIEAEVLRLIEELQGRPEAVAPTRQQRRDHLRRGGTCARPSSREARE